MKYKFIEDLTSDVMYEAYGKDLKELFENSALALFSVICKVDQIKDKKARKVEIIGKDLNELMINWLQELISMVDTEGMFFSKFEIDKIDEKSLKAKVYGDDIEPELGETVVKAVTYHKFSLEKVDDKYIVRVTLDI